jgi:hypothetical protein
LEIFEETASKEQHLALLGGGWRLAWALNPIKLFEELARIASRETNTLCIRVWILRTGFSYCDPT